VARRLRILFSALATPCPPTNGQRLRNWSLIKAIVADGHEIELVSFGDPPDEATRRDILRVCRDFEEVPLPAGSAVWHRLRALPSPRPHGAVRHRSAAMEATLRRRLETGAFDAVICDDIYNVDNIPPSRVPILLNKHDITHVIVRRFLDHERSLPRRVYGRLEHRKLRRWETAACERFGRVLVVSDTDKAVLQADCPAAQYAYAPNVIDVSEYSPATTDDGRTVLYVGAMDWLPNRDAVMFFVTHVLPRLRAELPNLQFVIAGRAPEPALRQRLERLPNVRLTGTVPDMRAEIARAVVCTVPLRIGSGTRLKILEAGAMEKAIVSTRIGAEGLRLEHGRELLLADEPADFAAAIASLFRDPNRRRTLGAAARARVSAEYSVEALQTAMRSALTTLLAAGERNRARGTTERV
jgi:glycosyltransferase involved in cell wall biosynthesis